MDCKMEPDLLQGYLEGTVDSLERIIVEGHLEICDNCRRELDELKSLFSELQGLGDRTIDLPPEAALIRLNIVNLCSRSKAGKFSIKNFWAAQKGAFERAGKFMDFMPGLKPGAAYLEKGIKKAPHLLYKAIGGVFNGGRKLMMMRARA